MICTKLKFRNKIILTFLIVFIPLIVIGSTIAYHQVKKIIETGIEKQLVDTTDSLVKLIQTAASVSVKNRLRAIAEKNLDIAEYYYNKHRSGLLTRPEAIKRIEEIFLNQHIGISGYIYCLNSSGRVIIHPNDGVKNTNVSDFEFVRQQLQIKDGYLEYEWKNPEDKKARPKALYMVYFKPLDWIISVSSYREEFSYLVDVEDFRDAILSNALEVSGYAYIIDESGNIIVHPEFENENLLESTGEFPNPIGPILEKRNGKIRYFWRNPRDASAREKIVIFKHMPEFKWIVASASYVDKVYAPLRKFWRFLMLDSILLLFCSIGITYLISTAVTRPFTSLMEKLEKGAKGDFSVRMNNYTSDEFGRLSRHFNYFMTQIETEIQINVETRAALVENDLKLRSLFNQSFQYTGILSPSGIIEKLNQSGLDFAGVPDAEVMNKFYWDLPFWRHDAAVREQLKTAIQKATEGNLVRYETTGISRSNEIRDIDISIKPVLNSLGEVVFIITEARDITEIKQAAVERKNLAVQLEKSQKMEAIGTLAGGIAHDFNNILSGIMGHAQLAEMTLDSPVKAKNHIRQITKGAQRAGELTQQILTFSHRAEYKKRPLKLYLVVKEALKLLRSSIPVTIEISERIISREKVLADPTQMLQVIINLCTNAYHAMEEKGGCLTVHLTHGFVPEQRDFFGQKKTPGKYVTLLIEDTGRGMEKEILLKAFDPYFSTKPVGKGTGFGLALVSAIVEEHDGYIKAKSTPGIGTRFYIFLPVVVDKVLPPETKFLETLPMEGVGNIMVVDDEIEIRQIIQQYFASFGYQVSIFENAIKAFEAFEVDPDRFDLMITDMTMPGMTGAELAEKVLTLRPDFPIILCTGYSESITEEKACEMGISRYALKPVDNRELVRMVREILYGRPKETDIDC